MGRAITICFAILALIAVAAAIVLAVFVWKQPRFVQLKGDNPYIMFDNKTAQACWSGPSEYAGKGYPDIFDQAEAEAKGKTVEQLTQAQKSSNSAHLPFCKNLH